MLFRSKPQLPLTRPQVREHVLLFASLPLTPKPQLPLTRPQVREHVLLFAGLRGIAEAEVDVKGALLEIGLYEKVDSQAGDLSGGQKRKPTRPYTNSARPQH